MAYTQRKTIKHSFSLLFAFLTAATLIISVESACDDVAPGPEHTCQQQAIEWKKCGEPWMKDKCNKSCGRCGKEDGAPNPGTGTPVPNPSGAKPAETTRYWDCNKPSCSWPDKAQVTRPVKACAKDGKTPVDKNEQSAHEGGNSYTCNDQQPWKVNDDLSYGFAAVKLAGQAEGNWCCACYELTFTNDTVKGKRMIVQATNTGYDLGENHFDIQIPGGGVGNNDGCTKQFGRTWGEQNGGVGEKSECDQLPKALQSGCRWKFDWFKNANNPSVNFKEVKCPSALKRRTQCARKN